MSFPEQLRKIRTSRGYTQKQIADMMGIKNSTYCGYETGKRQPDVAKIKQLAKILNTSGDILLETGFAEKWANQPLDAGLSELVNTFQALSPDFQDCALAQMKKLAELQVKKQEENEQRDSDSQSR